MIPKRNGRFTNSAVIILLIILIVYLVPVWTKSNDSFLSSFSNTNNGFKVVFTRSLFFALASSLISVIAGLWIAFVIIKTDLYRFSGKVLSILIIPFLLGSTSVAFVFKMVLLNTDLMRWAYEKPFNLFIILTIIQFWQFGTLFTYLFWLSLKSIGANLNQYASATLMTKWEYFKDICVPNFKGLLFLLALISFIFSFYEDVKISLIFRVSEGLNAELISHWIFRNYQSNLLIGYNYALQKIIQVSQDTLFGLGAIFLFFGILRQLIPGVFRKMRGNFNLKSSLWISNTKKFSYSSVLLTISIIIPLAIVFFVNKISFEKIDFLILPLVLSFLGALLATILAIVFSFFTRLMDFDKMGGINLLSVSYLGWLYIIMLIPPLLIMLGGFEWMNLLNIHGYYGSILFWLVGHTILSLPILGSFLMITNFKITSNELNYCKIYNIPRNNIFNINFFKKFKADYLLTFLFAFSIILNEGLLNKVFSDKIPSFVSVLNDSISSKNADYSLSMLFFLLSLIIAFVCIGIWIWSMKKHQDEKNIA